MKNQLSFSGYGVSLAEKEQAAIDLLREHEDEALSLSSDGYYLAFSGGKDSCVIKELAIRAGVKYKAWYSQTTIDPPELVRFIKQQHPEVEWVRPFRNFFRAIVESHGVPTRAVRWCCEEFKERGGDGMLKILGVRAAESARRKKTWKPVTHWRGNKAGLAICPIVYWSDAEVWEFIKSNNLPYCSLYDEGWKRLGCIGCPMAGAKRVYEFKRWTRFESLWRKSFLEYFEQRKGKLNRFGKPYYIEKFKDADEMFDWWMSDKPTPQEDEQECLGLFDE